MPSMDKEKLRERLEPCLWGSEHVRAGLDAGRGVIMPLPHSGNWDMAGVWLVQHFGTFTTVAERLKPESLYKRFIDYRESLGFEMLPLTGGERPPFEVLAERLRDNGIVCLMADRDLTRSGVEVDFFGEPTRMPAGTAKLAIETGAVVLPTHCYNTRDSWVFDVTGPLDTSSGDVTDDHPGDGRPVRQGHRRPSRGLAHAAAAVAGRSVRGTAGQAQRRRLMRIGMVCPYSFDVHGGVQSHVLQLAEVMRDRGHDVSVLAPCVAARRVARLRRVGWQGRSDSVQRVGRAAAVRPGHAPKGQALAHRR